MVKIFVCVTCRHEGATERPGVALADALEARLATEADPSAAVRRVDCLAVCERPCTIALAGKDKWTYLIGDVEAQHADDIVVTAGKIAAAASGIVPLRERPPFFRKGVIARVPPLSFEGEKS